MKPKMLCVPPGVVNGLDIKICYQSCPSWMCVELYIYVYWYVINICSTSDEESANKETIFPN